MNQFTQHYMQSFDKVAFEPNPAQKRKDPSMIVKSLRGLMIGAGIGAAGGGGLGAYMGNRAANNVWDAEVGPAPSQMSPEQIAKYDALKDTYTGVNSLLHGAGGAGAGALAGGLIGAVANPLFN